MLSSADRDVIGVQVRSIGRVKDWIEPADQARNITRPPFDHDRSAAGQIAQLSGERSLCLDPVSLDMSAASFGADEQSQGQIDGVEFEVRLAGGNFEMYGTVNFRGTGSLSINVRGRFGSTWGD